MPPILAMNANFTSQFKSCEDNQQPTFKKVELPKFDNQDLAGWLDCAKQYFEVYNIFPGAKGSTCIHHCVLTVIDKGQIIDDGLGSSFG